MAKKSFPPRGGMGGGMGGGQNMNNILKQAQKMQQDVEKKQQELSEREFEASSGGGMVKAKVNGDRELLSIKIAAEVVDPEDIEMLEDLVLSAVNEALRSAEETSSEELGKLTGGMNLGF